MTRKRIWPIYDGGSFKDGKFERRIIAWAHYCPACQCIHRHGLHSFRDDEETLYREAFSFPPHKRVVVFTATNYCCRYRIVAGEIYFHAECTHKLAGQVVAIPEWAPADLLPKQRRRSLRNTYPVRCFWSFVFRYVMGRKP